MFIKTYGFENRINIVTEFVLPPHWIYNKTDHVNIKAIHKAHGSVPLKTYPFMDLKVKKWLQMVKKVKSHSILNFVPYNKADVKQLIIDEMGWRDYGAVRQWSRRFSIL